ncbi:hypothetical protein ELD05_06265 [Caldicellulosiruptor changbaiensis]|uniref:Uncharacterized protein n=1 Tax=Caldicellulosiruptor changbaiensis TaxID=1222016 RepID=A0A3T0D5I8_9FIRM|nr:hypothetical protein [Caldicellulosiruptor changbaiensis]AZT90278.1 hypothetical protein ELD05_06265 [Caldicellulosiruptor changbaiensis]
MKDIVNLALKVLWGINLIFCVMVFAYSKSIAVFIIVLGSSVVLLFILYSLLLLLKSALRGKINFIYLLLHSLAVVVLILLSAFIFKFYNVRFVYFLWTLISYPLIFIVSYVVAYIYKTSSRK